ncbi:hypothetical protein [Luteimonas qiangzhengi]|uniref:hypothetical protein n=1 Tax=Luteimonas sp. MJ146 TaxID=3129240 RepID=UPI0031B9B45A
MDKELLKQAQQRLRIRDVYQIASHAKLAEGYDPTQDSGEPQPVIQFKHQVRESVVLEPDNDSDAPDLFRVYIDLGVRWRFADEDESDDVYSEISATYVSEYEIHEEIEPDALTEFALHNASFHVWPYFREYVASQSQRMNAPKLTVPMMRLASNRPAHASVRETDG